MADACVELVKMKNRTEVLLRNIRNALEKIFYTKGVYIHNEDGRMIRSILAMLNRGLEIEEVETLIKHMPMEMKSQKKNLMRNIICS